MSGQCGSGDPLQGVTIQNSNFLCGNVLDGFQGKLPNVDSPSAFQPADLCAGSPGGGGQPDNILWYSFIATSFSFDLTIFHSNCGGPDESYTIQAGIYGDLNFDEKVACHSFPGEDPVSLVTNSAVPGKIYYLFIDGFEGATCDFTIQVNSGLNTDPYIFDLEDGISGISAVEDGLLIQDNANVCAGDGILYTYQAPVCEASAGSFQLDTFSNMDLFCYEWTIDPPGSGIIVGAENEREVVIDWQVPGNYTLSVDITPLPELDACAPSICTNAASIEINSSAISYTTNDTIFFCAQDPPTYCGDVITETTTITCIEDNSNCIQAVQPFVLLENDTIDYGTFVNCGDKNCFVLFGLEYCVNGDYVRPDTGSCNLFHKFSIEGFFVDINLPSSMELDCNNGNLELIPNVNTNYQGDVAYEWYMNNQLVGTEENMNVDGTGTYELRVTFPDLTNDCGSSQSITITESVNAPEFTLNVPVLDCNTTVGTVEFVEVDPISSIEWEGPNGFVSSNESITLNEGGAFKLTVIGENGCLSDTTFTVQEDFKNPSIDLNVQDLNCVIRSTNANYLSDSEIESANWLLPDGFIVAADSVVINEPGNYELTLIGTNGCSSTQPFSITENLDMPVVDAGMDQTWQCNTEKLTIEGTVSDGPHELSWSFVEKGNILTDRNQPTIEVSSEGTYILKALNFESGCETSDSMTIARNEDVPDTMEYVKIDPSCFETSDGMIQVINVNGGTEPYRYFLNGVQAEEDFMDNLQAGIYALMVLDDYDCRLIVDVDVEEQPEISLEDMPAKITIGYNEFFTFYAEHNLEDDDVQSIEWFDANGVLLGESDSLLFQTQESTEIGVEVTNLNGCSAFRSIPIEVDFDLPVFAPNIFSPNEDGFNDYFTLFKRDDYPSEIISMSIFNRWGEQVFFKRNFDFGDEAAGWDGRRNGQLLENAVFTYTAVVRLVDGQEKIIRGDVTLVR